MTASLRTFGLIWIGQLVSLTGSGLTDFALGVWVFQHSGSATQFAGVVFFLAVPRILLSPLAGALADRWDRRWLMVLSDAGAGLGTLALALLFVYNRLEVWHIYLITLFNAACGSFQWPAYASTITLLVPKAHYGRASGIVQAAGSIASLLSPLLAGFLMVRLGLGVVIFIDFATFLFAALTLLAVRFPRPLPSLEGDLQESSLLRQAVGGWFYLRRRPGLLGLLLIYAGTSFLGITTEVLLTPYVLSFSSADVLGLIVSATGGGLLLGSLVLSTWGGPKRRVYGIFLFEALVSLCTLLLGFWTFPLLIAALVLIYFTAIALSDGCSQALWQAKVAPDFQGRVFALRQMISLSAFPLGLLITAPLAEFVFEPLLVEGGQLAITIGWFIGTGPGRGIGLVFILTGLFNLLVLSAGFFYPRIRRVEDELPDAVGVEAAG